MLGNQNVLEQLNTALASELTAIAQYMAQSEMCGNWGYGRLGGLTKARAIEEMGHAEGLIERIIFLDAIPAVNVALKPNLGKMFRASWRLTLPMSWRRLKSTTMP